MNFFLFIFFALLVFVTIGMLVVFYYVRKGIRFFRRMSNGEMTEEEFQHLANKHFRGSTKDGDNFDKDYFKGHAWQRGANRQQQSAQHVRTTRTANGVTIVDRRNPDDIEKKIFTKDEGEYVDFTD